MTSAYTSYVAPSSAFTFVNERRADHLRLPKGHPLGGARKGDRRECPRAGGGACSALGDGCLTPNLAISARAEDRALQIRNVSFAGFEAFLTGRCLDFRHWPDLAGLASAYAGETSVAFNWTGSCVTRDRGVVEDSAQDGPDPRVHGQRSTRR
jgi:hypothetical protein